MSFQEFDFFPKFEFLLCLYGKLTSLLGFTFICGFRSSDHLNYVTLSNILSMVALLLKTPIRKLFAYLIYFTPMNSGFLQSWWLICNSLVVHIQCRFSHLSCSIFFFILPSFSYLGNLDQPSGEASTTGIPITRINEIAISSNKFGGVDEFFMCLYRNLTSLSGLSFSCVSIGTQCHCVKRKQGLNVCVCVCINFLLFLNLHLPFSFHLKSPSLFQF